jgi:DNA-binding response OmpR family regulator
MAVMKPDIIILDADYEKLNAQDVARRIKMHGKNTKLIMVHEKETPEVLDADFSVSKPVSVERFLEILGSITK